MFLNGLKAKSILRKIDKVVSERDYKSNRSKPRTLAILQENKHPFNEGKVKMLLKMLDIKKDQVTVLEYVKNIRKDQKEIPSLYSEKQLGWKGVFKTRDLKEFQQKPFDILVSYYTSDQLALKAMTALSNATLKVGISPDLEEMNDLTIHVAQEQEAVFIKEFEKYLKILKVID